MSDPAGTCCWIHCFATSRVSAPLRPRSKARDAVSGGTKATASTTATTGTTTRRARDRASPVTSAQRRTASRITSGTMTSR